MTIRGDAKHQSVIINRSIFRSNIRSFRYVAQQIRSVPKPKHVTRIGKTKKNQLTNAFPQRSRPLKFSVCALNLNRLYEWHMQDAHMQYAAHMCVLSLSRRYSGQSLPAKLWNSDWVSQMFIVHPNKWPRLRTYVNCLCATWLDCSTVYAMFCVDVDVYSYFGALLNISYNKYDYSVNQQH